MLADRVSDLASEKRVETGVKDIQSEPSLIETVFVVYIFKAKL